MDKIDLFFLNTGNSLTITRFNVTLKEKIKEDVLIENSQESRNSLTKIYSYLFETKTKDDTDYKSIKTLENNIVETFTFLKNNNLIPNLSPSKINFRFLRDSFAEQNTHNKEQFANAKLKDPTLNNEPIINISTEHVKLFFNSKNNIKGKFLHSLRKNFSNIPFNISTNNSNKIITELTTLHEYGHFLSAEKLRGTLISRTHRNISEENNFPISNKPINTNGGKSEIEINHMKNLARNILEGFSDSFSVYLTQKHYPNENIHEKYSQSRRETSSKSRNTINSYDLNEVFILTSKIKHKNIELLMDDFFNIAINNSINIVKKLIDTNPAFEKELKSQFEYYCKDLNIQLHSNKSLIENIEEQLKNACSSNVKLNNQTQINFNIQQIRNNSINKTLNNNIKP